MMQQSQREKASSCGRWMAPGPGRAASNWPVGCASTSNRADQPLIAKFASRFCNAWKDVNEDANLWGLFLKREQQN